MQAFPKMAGRSASALSLSRPAQALLTLRPAGPLSHLAAFATRLQPFRLPGRPARQLPINRQLSGWIPPPQVIRAFGAHGHLRTWKILQREYDAQSPFEVWRKRRVPERAFFVRRPSARCEAIQHEAQGCFTRLAPSGVTPRTSVV